MRCTHWRIGSIHEFGTPEYDALIPLNKRQPGSRAVVRLDVDKVGTVCVNPNLHLKFR